MSAAWLKVLAKRVLHSCGLELQRLKHVNSERTVLRHILKSTQPAVVLDVGANTGQYAALLRDVGFRGKIVSFEALPDVHAVLENASARDGAWIVAPCAALGRKAGTLEINRAGNSVSSSLLPMLATHVDAAPDSAYVGTQTVRVERLDVLAEQLVAGSGNLMLKIDTQGYEREVLEGATRLMPRITALQVEISLVSLYEGAPTLTQIVSHLESCGYQIFSLVPGFRDARTGRLLQMDGFFIRVPQ